MGKIVGFSQKQRDQIEKQANEFWDLATTRQAPFFQTVEELERMARGLLPIELENAYASYEDRSHLVPPDIYNNLNSMKATIRKAVFNKKPYFKLSHAGHPTLRNESIKKAERVLQGMNDMQSDGTGFDSEADTAHHQVLYAGITCVFTQWVRNFEKSPLRDQETKKLVTDDDGRVIFVPRMVSQYAESIALDIRRSRVDPAAAERKDIRIVGYHSLMPYTNLISLNRLDNTHYDFKEEDLLKSTFERAKYFEYINDESDKADKANDDSQFTDKQIEVKSIRGIFRFDKPNGGVEFKDLIVELGNGKLIALKENDLPIPGYELFDFPAIDVQHGNMYVMGIVEPARDVFIEQFIKRNQSLDNANRNTYLTYIGDATACNNLPNYIASANDQLLKLDMAAAGLSDVRQAMAPLQRPQLGQDTFNHSIGLKTDVQQTMRLNDYTQGLDPGRAETATGVVELTSGSQNVTEHMITRIGDTFYRPAMKKKLILWNFFMADQADQQVFDGEQLIDIQPGELDMPYHIALELNINATNPSLQRRLVELTPLLIQDPFTDQAVLRDTISQVLELPNGDKIFPPEQYSKIQVDRESALLGYGFESEVHPLDNHAQHIRFHTEYLEFISQIDPEMAAQQGMSTKLLEEHIEGHQLAIEQMNGALGNVKAGGGLAGDLNKPGASQTRGGSSPTGQYTPKEGRA